MEKQLDRKEKISYQQIILLILMGVFIILYQLLRFEAMLGEVDTTAFSSLTQTIIETGKLISEGKSYPHGYAYQTLLVNLSYLSGLSIIQIQNFGATILFLWLIIPAWMLFRELFANKPKAMLATILLFVHPEFLFPVMRGSHEKFSRGLMFLVLYVFLNKLKERKRFGKTVWFTLVFYILTFALISMNNMHATSFLFAICIALLLLWIVSQWNPDTKLHVSKTSTRLGYVIFASLIIAFIFSFYFYEPAQRNLLLMQNVWERILSLILDVETQPNQPYQYVTSGWINLQTYIILSLSNWIFLIGSGLIWLQKSWKLFRNRQLLTDSQELLLWAFYGGFAFVFVLTLLADFAGGIAGNFQLRIFPSLMLFAIPMITGWLAKKLEGEDLFARFMRANLWVVVMLLGLFTLLKFTNEPLFSNYWQFNSISEYSAIWWADRGLSDRTLWVGFDERLKAGFENRAMEDPVSVYLDKRSVDYDVNDFLVSSIMRTRSVRLKIPLPIEKDDLVTYDNGDTQIYHSRPANQFQK